MHQSYVRFRRGGATGVCIPELEPHLDFFTKGFENWLSGRPIHIFLERPNRVFSLRLPAILPISNTQSNGPAGFSTVVKQFGWRSPIHRILRPLAGSKAIRSFRIAMILRGANVATPRPLIAWDRQDPETGTNGCYITEEIGEAATLRQILKSPGAYEGEKDTFVTELAHLVRGMHDSGILHRDLTIGNFLVSPKPVEGRRIFLIDLSRSLNFGRVPLLLRLADMARMKLFDLWPEFYALYCQDRPAWKRWQPVLDSMIWLRRRKMDLRKSLKSRQG